MAETSLAGVAVPGGLVGGPFGSTLVGRDYVPEGVPVIRGGNLSQRYVGGDFVYVSPEKWKADLVRNSAVPGDIVFTQRGTLGQVSMVPDGEYETYVVSQSQMRLRVDPSIADSRFVYYACTSQDFRRQIDSRAIATGVPHINLGILSTLTVPMLGLPVQQAIAEVLGALDDKIAANDTVLRKNLALADAYFLHARALGEERVTLGEVAEFLNRRRIPLSSRERDARRGNVPYYGAAARVDFVDEALFDEPLLLVGEDGTVVRDDGSPVTQYIWGPAWVNNHAHVIRGRGPSTELLRVAVRLSNVAHLVTGAVQPKLSMRNLRSLEVALPSSPGHVERSIEVLAGHERALVEESRRLAVTRDELLPLLMSGKVRVRDAEKRVEEVL